MQSRHVFSLPGAKRHYARDRVFDLDHLKLVLRLDEKRKFLESMATLRLRPFIRNGQPLELDLSTELQVHDVQLGGKKASYEHENDCLRISLGRRQLLPGQAFEIGIRYSGSPSRGLHFIQPTKENPEKPYEIWSQGQDEDSKFWFPCFDHPNAKATSEIIATVRQPNRVIANGKLLEVKEDKRRRLRTFHWREDFPHSAYLTSIVVGEFHETVDQYENTKLYYYVPVRYKSHVQRTFGNTPAMIKYFSEQIGYPYPYEKYSQVVVHDFIFGGMENISATTLTDSIVLDATAAKTTTADPLLSHELAHQWWGNLLTCKEWAHGWLNEGFATYFECLWTEHHKGPDEFHWQVHQKAQSYFEEDRSRYRRPIVAREYSKPIELFDRHLYEKGALVLHMLRRHLGDELFWKALQHYARRYQFQNVETHDLKIAIEEASGRHLDAFFEQWIHSPGYPEFEVSWSWESKPQRLSVTIRQTQSRKNNTPLFAVRAELEWEHASGVERQVVELQNREHTLHFVSKQRPLYVRFDPQHWLLKKLDMRQNRDAWLAQLERTDDLFGQVDAAKALEKHAHDARVERALIAALRRNRFFAVQGAVAHSLAQARTDEARSALLKALGSKEPKVRRRVVEALAVFKKDPIVARSLRARWKDPDYFVRAAVLVSLAKIRAPKILELCRTGLGVASFRDVIRCAAMQALVELEDERGFDLCRSEAEHGKSRWRRDAAMKSMAKFGTRLPHLAQQVQDRLEDYLNDKDFFARHSAVAALRILGRTEALPALQRVAARQDDARLQRQAQEAIGSIREGAKEPEKLRSLQNEVEKLQDEGRWLRQRIEKLEQILESSRKRSG